MPTIPPPPSNADSQDDETVRADRELMRRIQGRDARALQELHRKYRALMLTIAIRAAGSSAADEICQDCLLNIWNSAHRYVPALGTPLAWIATIAHRRSIDFLRKSDTYHRTRRRFEVEPHDESVRADALDACQKSDLLLYVQKHLALLPRPQRDALQMTLLNGLSQRELANVTNTPLGTIKTRIELGLKKLRFTMSDSFRREWQDGQSAA